MSGEKEQAFVPIDEGEPAGAASGEPASLHASSGILTWQELARHFARGVVVLASPSSDLIEVAESMVADDTDSIRRLIDSGALARASDDDARAWVASESSFRCVVVAPWVLVQPLH